MSISFKQGYKEIQICAADFWNTVTMVGKTPRQEVDRAENLEGGGPGISDFPEDTGAAFPHFKVQYYSTGETPLSKQSLLWMRPGKRLAGSFRMHSCLTSYLFSCKSVISFLLPGFLYLDLLSTEGK